MTRTPAKPSSARRKSPSLRNGKSLLQDVACPPTADEPASHVYELINGLRAIMWEADPKTLRYTFVSPRAEEMFGYPVERWLASNGVEFWTKLIHPEDRERIVRFSLDELSAGRDHEIKYRAIAEDGEIVWLHEVVRRQHDTNGQLLKLCGLMVDISDCKRSEEKYRAIFDNASMGIYQSSPDGSFLTANATLARLLGYDSPEELLALRMGDDVYFDKDARDRHISDHSAEKAAGIMCEGIEVLWKRRDGSPIWIHLNARSINDSDGNTLYYDGFVHDISQRKRVEEALRESEERYRELFENANDLVYTHDLEGNFLSVNKAAEKISGYSREELLKMNAVEVIRPEFRDVASTMQTRKLSGDEQTSYEVQVTARDGHLLTLEVNSRLIRDKSGTPVAVQGIGRDITARRRAEEALRESEERFRALVEHSSDIVNVLGADGAFLYENQSNQRQLGYEAGEVLGAEAFDFIHPDDRERVERVFAEVVANEGATSTVRFRFKHKDQSWRHFESTARSLLRMPAVGGVVINSRDVTEQTRAEELLRASEERFRAIIENAADVIALLDSKGTMLYVNPSGARRFGFGPHELLGTDAFDLVHRDDLAHARDALARAIARSGETIEAQYRYRHKDGSWRHLESNVQSMLDNPAVGGVVVNSRDVTELVRLREELRRSETMSAVGSLVAGVAHEVRNPLFSITATLDSFEARFGEQPEYGKHFALLRGELARMGDLMNDLLDYSKPTSLVLSRVSAVKLMGSATRACAARAKQARVNLVTQKPPVDLTLLADQKRLIQVLQNLLENAIHHSPARGKVCLSAKSVTEGDHSWVEFEIADGGQGIREEDLTQIFEPFFTRRRGGTGLGLSIVQRIVEEHHGYINASNRAEGGARMCVRLPLAAD